MAEGLRDTLVVPSSERIPGGYHEAVVTAITVMIAFTLGFLLFWTVQPESGEWTTRGTVATVPLAGGTVMLFIALYRSLSLRDEQPTHYKATVNWFFTGVSTVALAIVLAVYAMAR